MGEETGTSAAAHSEAPIERRVRGNRNQPPDVELQAQDQEGPHAAQGTSRKGTGGVSLAPLATEAAKETWGTMEKRK